MKSDLENKSKNSLHVYACPETHTPLVLEQPGLLRSTTTNKSFPIVDGVPVFSNLETIAGTYNANLLEETIEVAKQKGWLQAVNETESISTKYITDETRAIYLDILPLNSETTVLEIGSSMAQHTHLLAKRSKHVYGLEVVPEQAKFAQIRCTQMGYANVNIAAGGEECSLPFLENSFDLIILNYVLEWCAGRSFDEALILHKKILSECHLALKPGGHLYVSTKNRYALRLLKGGVDEHVDLRFGNALPRWLMKILLGIFKRDKNKPPGYLHSYGALQNLLLKVGFEDIETFWAIPDGRYPVAYLPFSKDAAQQAKTFPEYKNFNRLVKFLIKFIPLKLKPWLAPSLVFLMKKQISD